MFNLLLFDAIKISKLLRVKSAKLNIINYFENSVFRVIHIVVVENTMTDYCRRRTVGKK